MATQSTGLIEMVEVGKLYGNIRALQGISLKVGAGEVTCVLGDNGAGKSSLIKIMAGVHQHDEGTYKVEGEEVRFGSPREALNRGIAGMKRTAKAELLDMGIDLRDVEQPIGTLSGGERQSVAIARAVHFGAKVLILDEPTSALGVKQAGVVLKYILQSRDRGIAVIFITHNPHHAYPVGDRFVILNRGQSLGTYA